MENKEPYEFKAARLRYLIHRRGWRLNSGISELAALFEDAQVSDYAKASCYVSMLEYAGVHNDPMARLACLRVSENAQKSLNTVQEILLTTQPA